MEIVDPDDVTPVFPRDVIRLEFREDTPVSTLLYVGHAGAPAGSTVSYSLQYHDTTGSGGVMATAQLFSVDRWTGQVRLRGSLDRETAALHQFSLLAASAASTERRNCAQLSVVLHVLDTNDHAPVFSQPSYACHVTVASATAPICTLSASDLDAGDNARIVYFLSADVADEFHVDSHSAHLYALRPMSAANRTLSVVATDSGALPRTARALVHVTSHVPSSANCAVESLDMRIEENRAAYSVVGSVHLVYDDGTSVRAVARYQLIQDGGRDSFDVNATTGEIVTKLILDREERSEYRLSVSAAYTLPGASRYNQRHPGSTSAPTIRYEMLC